MGIELGETKAVQLAAMLRRQIERGELRPGDVVPSQTVLTRDHGVSSTTIREAMSALAAEGWIERSQGRATRVAPRPQPARTTAAVLITGFDDPFYAELLQAVQTAAEAAELRLLLFLRREDGERMTDQLARLRWEGVRAAMVAPVPDQQRVEELLPDGAGPPRLVSFGAREPVNADCVTVDRSVGVEQAVRHLHGLGHRRIVLLCRETTTGPWSRLLGLERARAALGLSPAECRRVDEPERGDLRPVAQALFDSAAPPTAVICNSDLTALHMVQLALEHGLRVPQDLSIVGVTVGSWGEHAPVPLTSVNYRTDLLGSAMVRLVYRALNGDGGDPPAIEVIQPQLIVRASTAPPGG